MHQKGKICAFIVTRIINIVLLHENYSYCRLTELSKLSKFPFQALPVQLPFHQYEEKLYSKVAILMPIPLQSFVEQQQITNNSTILDSSLEMGSPMKV